MSRAGTAGGSATARRNIGRADPTAGIAEDYHIEAAYGWWNAKPELIVNSESLGILGTDVDLISDLGIEQHRLGKFDLVLKPSKKHRFKYQHLPIKYSTDAFPVQRSFIFNGQRYNDRPAGDDDRGFLERQFRLRVRLHPRAARSSSAPASA